MARHRRAHRDERLKHNPAKAGKRSGGLVLTEPNPDNTARRVLGEKQFELARTATVEYADRLGKVVARPVPFAWDPIRKHILFSPVRKKESA